MNGQQQNQSGGIGLIILLVILYIIFNPIPGPIDDAAVALFGGYQALKRLWPTQSAPALYLKSNRILQERSVNMGTNGFREEELISRKVKVGNEWQTRIFPVVGGRLRILHESNDHIPGRSKKLTLLRSEKLTHQMHGGM
jgi:hypothetical protein